MESSCTAKPRGDFVKSTSPSTEIATKNGYESCIYSMNNIHRACVAYWNVGIVYCTCGHFLRDDTAENKKYIKSVLDLFSFPHTVTGTGRKKVAKNSTRQNNSKRSVGRNNTRTFTIDLSVIHGSEKPCSNWVALREVILEMDRLANEDHTHIATEEEINVYRGNWWIRSNFVVSDTMPVRHRPDFKKALSTLHRVKKAEDEAHYQNWWQSSSSSCWQWQDSWWYPSPETSSRRWT